MAMTTSCAASSGHFWDRLLGLLALGVWLLYGVWLPVDLGPLGIELTGGAERVALYWGGWLGAGLLSEWLSRPRCNTTDPHPPLRVACLAMGGIALVQCISLTLCIEPSRQYAAEQSLKFEQDLAQCQHASPDERVECLLRLTPFPIRKNSSSAPP